MAVVVEDDEDIRELLVALLGQSGFEVHAASSGAEGVEAVEHSDPVIVTIDLGLPDIDGYEVTRRVRRLTDAYVVMLTARGEEIDTLMGLDAGADDYLTKPFRPRELRARIEAMLRRPRSAPGGEPAPHDPVPGAPCPDGDPAPTAPAPPAAPRGSTNGSAGGAGGFGAPAAGSNGSPAGAHGGTVRTSVEERLHLDGLVLSPQVHHVSAAGREVALTPTEFTLLETLLRSGRVVRSKTELSRILRGESADAGTFVSEADARTVEVHVGNLRRKLKDDPREPRWIETVRGIGYRATDSARPGA